MGEMREWWANLYMRPWGDCVTSLKSHATKEAATAAAVGTPVVGRVHVRLKPEGAPRRYASEEDRWWWERAPELARGRAILGEAERLGLLQAPIQSPLSFLMEGVFHG